MQLVGYHNTHTKFVRLNFLNQHQTDFESFESRIKYFIFMLLVGCPWQSVHNMKTGLLIASQAKKS